MATARDQAARILRQEPDPADGEAARDETAALADQLRAHMADETVARRPAETPERPAIDRPAVEKPPRRAGRRSAAPKSGRRRLVLMGIIALLALAAAGYGVNYFLVGRFYVSTDDAYVRANNTMLGARVSGHIEAIFPADNALVHAGDVVFKIDDGDYRIAVDAARTKIATQQATIDRIGRQVTAQESAVDQAQAQPRFRGSRTEAGEPRLRPAADPEHQGLCHPRHLRTVRGRPRPGPGRREGRAGGL